MTGRLCFSLFIIQRATIENDENDSYRQLAHGVWPMVVGGIYAGMAKTNIHVSF